MRAQRAKPESQAQSSFCEGCVASLNICESCGAATRPNTKFCRKMQRGTAVG